MPRGVVAWAQVEMDDPLAVAARPSGRKGFAVLPWRWVVGRSFAWIGRDRRLNKEYKTLTTTCEAMIGTESDTTTLQRLATRRAL
jgi:putative transposase